MSVEIFTWLTSRFKEDYMKILKFQNGMFVSFSLGWSESSLPTWRCQPALKTLSVFDFVHEVQSKTGKSFNVAYSEVWRLYHKAPFTAM